MGFGSFASFTQFCIYGRRHFTKTGWEAHRSQYPAPDLLESPNLDCTGRVYIVTGANSGIGREIARFLLAKGAEVYMLCRSRGKAEAALQELVEETACGKRARLLVGDCSLQADVRRCWGEFQSGRRAARLPARLDGLVCNAGALLNEKTLTADGWEVTFATHLLFGTYLLGSLALPLLRETADARLVVVSSGGMYLEGFPEWEKATGASQDPYDGQRAYEYAKRGQVLLCERWAASNANVKVVSCHPGWTGTPGVDAAFGDQKSYLEPMRNTWEGAEGIIWLCVAPGAELQSGAFYLDREPQVKHMAGPFFTEGWYTQNTPEEVDEMMRRLDESANGTGDTPRDLSKPLVAMDRPIELKKFMGRWYVLAHIPTYFDRDTTHNTEDYEWDEERGVVQVDFTYRKRGYSEPSVLKQRASVIGEACTTWEISPKFVFYVPLRISYLIVHCAEDYSTAIIGVPDRSYVWIMARAPEVDRGSLDSLVQRAVDLGYDAREIVEVPQ